MQAVAVYPDRPGRLHAVEVPEPRIEDIPGGRGVLVEVHQVGLDGTDREIWAGEYGRAPEGCEFLILGHESFGRVVEVGPEVRELAPGDYVAATSRRRGTSLYDAIGTYDMTPDPDYIEPGISLRHGFLTEYYVEDPEYLVRIPAELRQGGVLMEPIGIVEKAIAQAWEIQRRLKIWHPRRAAVIGTGSLGLLAVLLLRIRGIEVSAFARSEPPTPNSRLAEELGARYVSTRKHPLLSTAREEGHFDLIIEATGSSAVMFEAIESLSANGILVVTGISGGNAVVDVPGDRLMLGMVLGNKVVVGSVSENRHSLEQGIADMALAELQYPDWLPRLITHRVAGLSAREEMVRLLTREKGVIKVVVDVLPAAASG
jgi:threonine dehydrogenase-like Zn-dependent dehydrogenase